MLRTASVVDHVTDTNEPAGSFCDAVSAPVNLKHVVSASAGPTTDNNATRTIIVD